MFEAVVFDLDGIRVDSEGHWRSAYAAVVSQHLDEHVSPDELDAYEGGRLLAEDGQKSPEAVAE